MAWSRQKSESDPVAPPPPLAPSEPEVTGPKKPGDKSMDKLVNIGQSIQIKGELTGNEDLTVEGKVDGKIMLNDHHLTIGANGRINAEIHAKTVMIVGEVVGNVTADDKVEIAASGSMKGDIVAPRVVLCDGARFKGSIDMDRKPASPPPLAKPPLSGGAGGPSHPA
jgi:cytoskeletal protein CcmA (bactofilin family)